jgi:ubiquinone/menaquinone biosynthesis C-methylase UbiE
MNLESSKCNAPINKRIHFQLMACLFRIRDLMHPPDKILLETGMKGGMKVLDFGCGPGGFSLAAANIVGREGIVYAVDNNPLAITSVALSAAARSLDNIKTLPGSCLDSLPRGFIDIVLLYDVLHAITEPSAVMQVLWRVLNLQGLLSVSDHHLTEEKIVKIITGTSLFWFTGQRHRTLRFEPVLQSESAA